MAQFIIPIAGSDAHFDLDVELSGTVYTLQLLWNTRAGHWTLSILAYQGAPIVAGQVLRADWAPILRQLDTRLPAGRLLLVDTSDEGRDPTEDDLGVRVLLVYDDGE